MPVTLQTFGTPSAASTTITLRGAEVKVHALTIWETDHLRANHAAPLPPLKKPADRGSDAEPEPDLTDTNFTAAIGLYHRERLLLETAVAIDYAPQPESAGLLPVTFREAVQANRAKAWIEGVVREWRGTAETNGVLTEAEIVAVRRAVNALTSGDGDTDAPGN